MSGDSDLTSLTVASGLDSLNVHGTDGGGTINDVHHVADNVNIEGDSHVTFGTSFAGGFTFVDAGAVLGGIIDAHTDTGGVTTWLDGLSGTNGTANTITGNAGWVQTYIGGTGGDTVHVEQFGGDLINFLAGGAGSTAEFNVANFNSGHLLANPNAPFQYNQVNGFTAADGINVVSTAALSGELLVSVSPTVAGAVGSGAAAPATNTFDFTTDTPLANATIDAFNYIKIDPPIAVTTGSTVQTGFTEAMGLAGSIEVSGGTHAYLTSYYDTTTSEAVIGTVHATGFILPADHIDVVALVHMSPADLLHLHPALRLNGAM